MQSPNPYAAPGTYAPAAAATYPCARCGQYGADYFPAGQLPMHRTCAGLGPDTLAWPWLFLAYSVVVPFGCTLIGAVGPTRGRPVVAAAGKKLTVPLEM